MMNPARACVGARSPTRLACRWSAPSDERCGGRGAGRRGADDGALVAFTHGEVDRPGSPRHQRDERWLVGLAEEAQRAVSSLEAKILDVGPARLRHAQAVQPEDHGKRGVGVIEALGSEQEGAKFAAIHAVALAWLRLRSADVLGGVRRDAPVDVLEPVVAAHCRQSPVDRRGRQAAVLHPAAVELDVDLSLPVWSGRHRLTTGRSHGDRGGRRQGFGRCSEQGTHAASCASSNTPSASSL